MALIKYDVDIGKRLRARRTLLGMSQDALAKKVSVTFQQVQKYEKGTNTMGANRLYQLAQVLGVPVAYFFEDLKHSTSSPSDTNDQPSDRESLEVMKAFNRIKEPSVRKRLADLVRAISTDSK